MGSRALSLFLSYEVILRKDFMDEPFDIFTFRYRSGPQPLLSILVTLN